MSNSYDRVGNGVPDSENREKIAQTLLKRSTINATLRAAEIIKDSGGADARHSIKIYESTRWMAEVGVTNDLILTRLLRINRPGIGAMLVKEGFAEYIPHTRKMLCLSQLACKQLGVRFRPPQLYSASNFVHRIAVQHESLMIRDVLDGKKGFEFVRIDYEPATPAGRKRSDAHIVLEKSCIKLEVELNRKGPLDKAILISHILSHQRGALLIVVKDEALRRELINAIAGYVKLGNAPHVSFEGGRWRHLGSRSLPAGLETLKECYIKLLREPWKFDSSQNLQYMVHRKNNPPIELDLGI